MLLLLVCVASLLWVANYLTQVLPTIESTDTCRWSSKSQLSYNARMLFVYFTWFVLARAFLFVPCVAFRTARVQLRTHGFCLTYCTHLLLRDGPLYFFVVGSLLFGYYLMESPGCVRSDPALYGTLSAYAVSSCVLGFLCLVLAHCHNRLLCESQRDFLDLPARRNAAPADTLSKLQALAFDPALFGDEGRYGAECTICLLSFEAGEAIRATPCAHAFHEECLARWLRTARTCPVCRRDMATDPELGRLSGPSSRAPLAPVLGPAPALLGTAAPQAPELPRTPPEQPSLESAVGALGAPSASLADPRAEP